MKKLLVLVLTLAALAAGAQDIMLKVDTAVVVPLNLMPLVDDDDGVTVKAAVVYNEAGLDLVWVFVTKAGATTVTAVTPTDTGGNYDFTDLDHGMYKIEIPASGGASINNDTEGHGWFVGKATDIAPWRSPVFQFVKANVVDSWIDSSDYLDVNAVQVSGATPETKADIVNEWETQSQADPTGFHVNVKEVNGTAQTAGDLGAGVAAILADTGTDGVVLKAAGLDADAATEIATAVIGTAVEDAITFAQAMRLMIAYVAGKADGGGTTTIHYRDQGDSLNRMTFTVDANGNRTVSVVNVTD